MQNLKEQLLGAALVQHVRQSAFSPADLAQIAEAIKDCEGCV